MIVEEILQNEEEKSELISNASDRRNILITLNEKRFLTFIFAFALFLFSILMSRRECRCKVRYYCLSLSRMMFFFVAFFCTFFSASLGMIVLCLISDLLKVGDAFYFWGGGLALRKIRG